MIWTRVLRCLAAVPCFAAAAATATAQAGSAGTGRIVGSVSDRTAGAPVPNVAITVVGTTLGARTGMDGKYSINDVPAGAQRIRAARIGYSPSDQLVTVAAGQTVTANLAIATATVTLDQMVVTGYGMQRRSDLTGSGSTVTPNVEHTPGQ